MNYLQTIFRVVDFETTGIDPSKDEIIEVGIVDVKYQDGQWMPVSFRQALCDPGIPIPPESSAVHHIVRSDVEGCGRTPDDLRAMLVEGHTENHQFAAHNAPFDQAFAGIGKPGEWLCTARMAKHLVPDSPSHSNQVLRYYMGFERVRVPGMDPTDPAASMHRALFDAYCTALILCDMLQDRLPTLVPELKTTRELLAYVDQPIFLGDKKVGFGKYGDKKWSEVPRDYLQWMLKQPVDSWDKDQLHTARTIFYGQ